MNSCCHPKNPNEKFFRLLVSVLEQLRSRQGVWLPITYFSLWAVRLSGFLEEMRIEDESLAIAKEMLTKPVKLNRPPAMDETDGAGSAAGAHS